MYRSGPILVYSFAIILFFVSYYFESTPIKQFIDHRIHHHPKIPAAAANRTLLPRKFDPLPLGSIRPTRGSWLEQELLLSAQGLAGHLWDFYAFVKDSTWLGGNSERGEYSALHEGFPYWFNGLVALAYSINEDSEDGSSESQRLKSQVHKAIDIVLKNQARDRWIGPETLNSKKRLLWGRFPFLLGLTSIVDANETAYGKRVIPALKRFVNLAHQMLKSNGTGFVSQKPNNDANKKEFKEYSYGRVRVADFILTLMWLLERTSTKDEEAVLWECMDMAYGLSLKWEAWYNEAAYIKEDLYRVDANYTEAHHHYVHGVNIAQGLKTAAVVWRVTHNESLKQTSKNAVSWTFKYHGAASGTILGDERINGLSPWSGSELCTTVETIFSLINIYHIFGVNEDADLAELSAFNALPSMLTHDHSAHQYVTQPNQPHCKKLEPSPFFDTNSLSQTFGLEPHYPCCTVNHPQGLPKFLAGSYTKFHGGFAHVLLSPGTLKLNGTEIQCRTEYPFTVPVDHIFNEARTDALVLEYNIKTKDSFSFFLRVPQWAKKFQVKLNDHVLTDTIPQKGSNLVNVDITSGQSTLLYIIDASIRVKARANDTVAIYHGPLLYALDIQSTWVSNPPRAYNGSTYPDTYAPPQFRDWIVTNSTPWNIAIDISTLKLHREEESNQRKEVWAAKAPRTYISARGCQIDWPLFKNVTPGAPPPVERRQCLTDPEYVQLVPLGRAKLHMAELPTIDLVHANDS